MDSENAPSATTTAIDQLIEPTFLSKPEWDDFKYPQRDFGCLPVPSWLRYDPKNPFYFGVGMNAAFGIGATFSRYHLKPCFFVN